ncbi:hypothetical protein KI387_009830 [Taxus chinensis]|uniref:ATP-dependent RNA helicase DHX29-like UBA domain-containing protein n=1 Tax=Taxus chinensis TaxID=29808 RepID=A0AA38FK57_TAXCH|nr:hypothetical protein KI387_009830 [Taxus chinensis]
MAPKKQQKGHKKEVTGKGKSEGSKSAPKVQISAQNEQKLRRLLQNNRTSVPPGGSGSGTMLEAQRTKRFRNIYDKLACEGFSSLQIEQALSALPEQAEPTLEAALDWLCFNIPGNELPLKFSSGVSVAEHEDAERYINLISTARVDWLPSQVQSEENREPVSVIALKPKINIEEEPQKLLQAEEADWIRRYINQQAEEECENGTSNEEASDDSDWETWTDSSERIRRKQARSNFRLLDKQPWRLRKKVISRNRRKQGRLIRELKQEMISLGLSEDTLNTTIPSKSPTAINKAQIMDSRFSIKEKVPVCVRNEEMATIFSTGICSDQEAEAKNKSESGCSTTDETAIIWKSDCVTTYGEIFSLSKENPVIELIASGGEEEQEAEEMLGLFNEEASADEKLPQAILEMQKKEKAITWAHGQALEKNHERWRKGCKPSNEEDLTKQPKAILQQRCQKCGWGAPKYERISGRGNTYSYSLTILRPTTGRGKNKKVGGSINFQLADPETVCESVDVCMLVRVATFSAHYKELFFSTVYGFE